MKLAKKVLMGALSGAMIFQCVPMVMAGNGSLASEASASEDKALEVLKGADKFRPLMRKMAETSENCLFLMRVAGVDVNCKREVSSRALENIVSAFSHVFDDIIKPVLDDCNECYGERPLCLKREDFVPEFLRDSKLNLKQKSDLFQKFAKSLDYKVRGNTRFYKHMCNYGENHAKFFKDVETSCYYAGILRGLHYELHNLVYSNVGKQDTSNVEAKGSESGSESGEDDVRLVTFPTIRVTSPEYEKDYLVSDSESGSESDSSEEASETEQNDAEQPAANEGEEVAAEKRDNFMVRFLRFISFGKLFKK